jgi:GT2 family glycosyltransferase
MLDIYSRAKENCLIAFFVGFYNKLACENKLLEIGRFFKSGSYSIGGSLERSAGLSKTLEIDIMSSCNMAVRRPLLESLEGFDEKFIYNHEDGDLSLRMKEKGYRLIFNPAMALIHEVNPARGTRSSAFFLGRDFGYFYDRHAMPRDIKAFLGLACNIAMLNAHWIGEMLRTKRPEPLYGNAGLWEGWRLAGDKR